MHLRTDWNDPIIPSLERSNSYIDTNPYAQRDRSNANAPADGHRALMPIFNLPIPTIQGDPHVCDPFAPQSVRRRPVCIHAVVRVSHRDGPDPGRDQEEG